MRSLTVLLVALVMMYHLEIILFLVPWILHIVRPISGHRDINWETKTSSECSSLPNIVLMVADDLGTNDISTVHHTGWISTPNIYQMSEEGIEFQNAYAGSPICSASRAALLTGRHATEYGYEFTPLPRSMRRFYRFAGVSHGNTGLNIQVNHSAIPAVSSTPGLPSEAFLIPELLKEAGPYTTAHIGKWHLGRATGMLPTDQGFDESLMMMSGRYQEFGDPDAVDAPVSFSLFDRILWATMQYAVQFTSGEKQTSWFKPKGYLTDYFTSEGIRFIQTHKGDCTPFFLYLAHFDVHSPLQVHKKYYDMMPQFMDHKSRTYAAKVQAIDSSVGRIWEELKDLDNTLFFVTSDNGGASAVGLGGLNKPYRGWKLSMFEGGIRVPFLARLPSRLQVSTARRVSHLDLFPTLASLLNVSLSGRARKGENLFKVEAKRNTPLFWRQGHHQAVISSDWKLIVSQQPDQHWLFHLQKDPYEKRNLVNTYPSIVRRLEGLLASHNETQLSPLWDPVLAIPVLIDKDDSKPYQEHDELIYFPN